MLIAIGIYFYYQDEIGLSPDNSLTKKEKCEKKLEECYRGGKKIFNRCCGDCYGEAEKACAPKLSPPLEHYYYPDFAGESYSEALKRYLREYEIYTKCIELYITSHPDYNKCLKKVEEYNKICDEEYLKCLEEPEVTR